MSRVVPPAQGELFPANTLLLGGWWFYVPELDKNYFIFKPHSILVIYYSRKRNPVLVRTRRQTTVEKSGDSGENSVKGAFILPGLLMTEMLTFILSQQPLSTIKQEVGCCQGVSATLTPLEMSCCAGPLCDSVYNREELSIFIFSRWVGWHFLVLWELVLCEEGLYSAIDIGLHILGENEVWQQ